MNRIKEINHLDKVLMIIGMSVLVYDCLFPVRWLTTIGLLIWWVGFYIYFISDDDKSRIDV